ncbi:ATP-binding protein [Streptomyces sp. NPDC057271]|uniref:ATP-binding protein n=1 Tax=unclassified Streptomyces TaxID=2593676 RepID=UPI00363B9FBF
MGFSNEVIAVTRGVQTQGIHRAVAQAPHSEQVRPSRKPPNSAAEHALPHDVTAPGVARCIVRTLLGDWGVPADSIDDAQLVVSEMVSNSIEHARGPVQLHVRRARAEGTVCLEVSDAGPAASEGTWTSSCEADEHGRGLSIVEGLAEACGFCVTPDGRTTHWARLAYPGQAATL